MHLQQTKRDSRESGGPQYYFHDLNDEVVTFLRRKGVVPVALVTPYGATPSHFVAVSKDKKIDAGGKLQAGSVGHDRIQMARAGASIGEAIRTWFGLSPGRDFERIDVDIRIRDGKFYLTPASYKFAGKGRTVQLERPVYPLSYNRLHKSALWQKQFKEVSSRNSTGFSWALAEIQRVIAAHSRPIGSQVHEADVLRASGPLKLLGLSLGPYLVKGFDCPDTTFRFLTYQSYKVPVEVKKRSSGFRYQEARYGSEELSRVVILCVEHDHVSLPDHVDVIELRAFPGAP